MPTLLTESALREAVTQSTFIHDGTVDSVEGIKIDLHMSGRVLKAEFSQPIHLSELTAAERSGLHVDPGEVVFVLTQERLELPNNIMAALTPKRTLAHSGIIVLGGLAVDPGYKGVLWLGLYNLSSTAYPIHEGKKLISAIFYQLTEVEPVSLSLSHSEKPLTDFPEELVTLIRNYKPIELSSVNDALGDVRRELAALKTDISNDKSWRESLKDAVEKYGRQVEATGEQVKLLSDALEKESEVRRRDDEQINRDIKGLSEKASEWISWKTIIGGLVLVGISVLAGYLIKQTSPATPPPPPPYYYQAPAPQAAPAPPAPSTSTPVPATPPVPAAVPSH